MPSPSRATQLEPHGFHLQHASLPQSLQQNIANDAKRVKRAVISLKKGNENRHNLQLL